MRNLTGRSFLMSLCLLAFAGIPAIAQSTRGKSACSEKNGSYSIQWARIANTLPLPPRSGAFLLPEKYEVFEVTAVNLKSHLSMLRKNGGAITVPFVDIDKGKDDVACLTFNVQNSGTIPKALNDKYPDIVSLKGFGTANSSNTIRFDYDGVSMNIAVVVNGVSYLYIPYKAKKKTYYLLFRKKDSKGSSRPAR